MTQTTPYDRCPGNAFNVNLCLGRGSSTVYVTVAGEGVEQSPPFGGGAGRDGTGGSGRDGLRMNNIKTWPLPLPQQPADRRATRCIVAFSTLCTAVSRLVRHSPTFNVAGIAFSRLNFY